MTDKQQHAMPGLCPMPVFSVEQIELIRRLRNSGITKDQIVHVFEALDRLEHELGLMYSMPISFAQLLPQFQQFLYHLSLSNAMTAQHPGTSVTSVPVGLPIPVLTANASLPPDIILNQSATASGRKRSAEEMMNGSHSSVDELHLMNSLDSNGTNTTNGVTNNGFTEPCIMDDNETPEVAEFVMQGETLCSAEIRNFVIAHNIKQQQVATLAGVSQSYVSRYLKGECYEMSARSRRAIQKWYLQYKNNPAGIVTAYNNALMNGITSAAKRPPTMVTLEHPLPPNPSFDANTVLDMMSTGNAGTAPKRERFVFRPNHLEILEVSFQEDNYPSHERREEVSKACNAATEMMLGRPLMDREKVTAQIVANWFANKRKELKKMAKDDGYDSSPVTNRPRGRPSRALIDGVESLVNEHSANGVANENGDNDSNVDSCDYTSQAAGNQAMFPDMSDEQALSMSVELAAVNQAIMSITGQKPVNIKFSPSFTTQLNKEPLPAANGSIVAIKADKSEANHSEVSSNGHDDKIS